MSFCKFRYVLCVSILPPILLPPFKYYCFILVSFFFQVVEPGEVISKTGLSVPHTSHCLGSGDIMISAMGDPQGNAKGMSLSYLDSPRKKSLISSYYML